MFAGKVSLALQLFSLLAAAQEWAGFTYNLSETESAAKAAVLEDDPADIVRLAANWESPAYTAIYSVALPIPPVLQPLKTITEPTNGRQMQYYEVEIKPFTQQVYPNLGPARLIGYNGISPGPTIIVQRGTETVVRFANNADQENSVHLHGSYSRAPWDGWAEDVTFPGQYKDYYYPNQQSARLMWYHDHAMEKTAENAYFGQAGAYIITDPAEDALNLPSGYGQFDIPLILSSKQYNSDGSLFSTVGETDSLWGDVIHVNGQPWPFFNVQPRKYRLRFLNAAVSRSFALYFAKTTALTTRLNFQVIASDTGLLTGPVSTNKLYLAMAERYEIVFDFSQYAGQSIELRNLEDVGGIGTDDDYEKTGQVMKFNVASTLAQPDTSTVPSTLRAVDFPTGGDGVIDHSFRFHRTNGEWRINGVGFKDVANRVLANVPRGTVEIWELENSSGGWTHPIHVHLVDFRVLQRQGGSRQAVEPYESQGLKDVVWLAKNEKVLVEAHYAPWDGVYMFHCHNLIHEDHDMMAAFNVTSLPGFGYDDSTRFVDPMRAEWRAQAYSTADMAARTGPFADSAIQAKLLALAAAKAYGDVPAVDAALDQYWASQNAATTVKARSGPISRVRRFQI